MEKWIISPNLSCPSVKSFFFFFLFFSPGKVIQPFFKEGKISAHTALKQFPSQILFQGESVVSSLTAWTGRRRRKGTNCCISCHRAAGTGYAVPLRGQSRAGWAGDWEEAPSPSLTSALLHHLGLSTLRASVSPSAPWPLHPLCLSFPMCQPVCFRRARG